MPKCYDGAERVGEEPPRSVVVSNLREAPQYGDDIFSEFVDYFLCILGRCLRRVDVL
jgi:hypothetical protein